MLIAAVSLGVAAQAFPITRASAEPEHRPGSATCSYYNRDLGRWVSYSQDQFIEVKDKDGHYHILYCWKNGSWHDSPEPAMTTDAPSAPIH